MASSYHRSSQEFSCKNYYWVSSLIFLSVHSVSNLTEQYTRPAILPKGSEKNGCLCLWWRLTHSCLFLFLLANLVLVCIFRPLYYPFMVQQCQALLIFLDSSVQLLSDAEWLVLISIPVSLIVIAAGYWSWFVWILARSIFCICLFFLIQWVFPILFQFSGRYIARWFWAVDVDIWCIFVWWILDRLFLLLIWACFGSFLALLLLSSR